MYQFLFTDDNFIVSLVIGLIILIGGYVLYDLAKKLNKAYIVPSILIIVFGYGLSGWGFAGVKDLVQANTTSVSYHYDVVKDGNIIQFTRKTNNWALNKKIAVKVIGKSKDAYQAEYHGDYYQISKTDVTKGN